MAHVLAELKIVPKTQCAEAAAIARELGLELQAKRYEKPLAENVFTPLTADEVRLWRMHCPTIYFTPPVATGNRSLDSYGFDSVPLEVMRHWKAIKDNYSFDTYQIWTTERTRVDADPLLIGVIGQKLYLLARWGMESPGDLSLKDIAQAHFDRRMASYSRWNVNPFGTHEGNLRSHRKWLREWDDTFAAAERYLGMA